MIEFLVDQNFNEDIVDGLTRRSALFLPQRGFIPKPRVDALRGYPG